MSEIEDLNVPGAATAQSILEPVKRLTRDMAKASFTLDLDEARFLVDAYYLMQHNRIAADGQLRSLAESKEPHEVLEWLSKQNEVLEGQVEKALGKWTEGHPVGQWLRSVTGIGPVIAAGFLAHIDIEQAPTAGHIWRYAGLDPTREWLGAEKAAKLVKQCLEDMDNDLERALIVAARLQNVKPDNLRNWASTDRDGNPVKMTTKSLTSALAKRPFNAKLKTLCWKLGESFVKVSGRESDVYGKHILARKDYEQRKNEAGDYAFQASKVLASKNIGKDTEAYKWYIQGKLPPGHIHARSKRWAVKIFISHLHMFWFKQHYGKAAPVPYPIAILGHVHQIQPK